MKKLFIFSLITFLLVLGYTSYRVYSIHKSKIELTEGNESEQLAVWVNGSEATAFPTKASGIAYQKTVCTNGGTGTWDATNWRLTLSGVTKSTTCIVYFGTNNP